MAAGRLVVCGGASLEGQYDLDDEWKVITLSTRGNDPNVNIELFDVARAFGEPLSPRALDLLEIAAYVYTMDCATNRGNGWSEQGSRESWGRRFKFIVPVQDIAFWSDPAMTSRLRRVLEFLSDDTYDFEFRAFQRHGAEQGYFNFSDQDDWPFHEPERVIMFSGGLDSLAGAAEMAAAGKNLVLVSHRPSSIMSRRQSTLFRELRRTYPVEMVHIPVWLNKASRRGLDRESTQRTRSFLFAALGAIVAQSVRAHGVRFFENGVVSLNLPVAQEAIRARASRTTHPYALKLVQELISSVLERQFEIDNPYLNKTKAEVVRGLADNAGAHLIAHSVSCAHQGHATSRHQYHCGTCSQCIDRRVAVMEAGLAKYDPETDYRTDVFKGARGDGYERNMAVNYAKHTLALHNMAPDDMAQEFNTELARAARGLPRGTRAIPDLVELHIRHANAAYSVLANQVSANVHELLDGRLPDTSMVAMVATQKHLVPPWEEMANRIAEHLEDSIPRICNRQPPENEPRLQEICDGVLRPLHPDLDREFPFMRWSASATKPDWSKRANDLWVELKYIRTKKDIRRVTEDIAADITKYGDNSMHTLFVVYDPKHELIDEEAFAEPISKHGHKVTFIR